MQIISPHQLKKKFMQNYCNLTDQQYGNLYKTHYHFKKYPLEKVYAKNETNINKIRSTSYEILFNKNFSATFDSSQTIDQYQHTNKKIWKNFSRQIYRPSRQKNNLFNSKFNTKSYRINEDIKDDNRIDKNKSQYLTIQSNQNLLMTNNQTKIIQQKPTLPNNTQKIQKNMNQNKLELQINKFPLVKKKQSKRKQMLIPVQPSQILIHTPISPIKIKKKHSFSFNKTAIKMQGLKTSMKEITGWQTYDISQY